MARRSPLSFQLTIVTGRVIPIELVAFPTVLKRLLVRFWRRNPRLMVVTFLVVKCQRNCFITSRVGTLTVCRTLGEFPRRRFPGSACRPGLSLTVRLPVGLKLFTVTLGVSSGLTRRFKRVRPVWRLAFSEITDDLR